MKRLMAVCLILLTGCDGPESFVNIPVAIPEELITPLEKPNRPLVTYKDAILRDLERGAVIDEANERFKSLRELTGCCKRK